MKATAFALAVLASVGAASPTAQSLPQTYNSTHSNSTRPKVILDNDWGVTGFVPILQALKAGWDVIGVVSDTANSWALQCGLHALAALEIGNLSCIPVYKGSDYPILNNYGLFQAWELVHGMLPWEGVFAPENLTAEALGNDPTGGDPSRISRSALREGFPNITFASDLSAAEFMVQQVRKYPGEVSIYSAGSLTNVALAVRLDSTFAKNAKQLVQMGGYIDVNILQTTGSVLLADLQGDINLQVDPEGTKIALSAPFPKIILAGNVANQVMSDQEYLDEVIKVKNPYTQLFYDWYGTIFPYWDETAMAIMLHPSIVKNSTSFYVDVDTSYASPNYGNIHAYQKALAPRAQTLQKIEYPLEIDADALKRQMKRALQYPPTCGTSK